MKKDSPMKVLDHMQLKGWACHPKPEDWDSSSDVSFYLCPLSKSPMRSFQVIPLSVYDGANPTAGF